MSNQEYKIENLNQEKLKNQLLNHGHQNYIKNCLLCSAVKFIKELEYHDDCEKPGCNICSIRDCPEGDPTHYAYEGCYSCFYLKKINLTKLVIDNK